LCFHIIKAPGAFISKEVKMKMKRVLLSFVVLMLGLGVGSTLAFACVGRTGFRCGVDAPNYGIDAASFLRSGIGARALGMGGAFVALADDSSAAFWNPAGLATLKSTHIGAMSTDRFGLGINFQFLGVLTNMGGMALGGTLVRSTIDDIEAVDEDGNFIGILRDDNSVLFGSTAVGIGDIFVGANAKLYNHTLGEGRAQGLGFDLGGLVWLDLKRAQLAIGASISDLGGTKIKWENTRSNPTDIVPQVNKVGAALKLFDGNLLMAVDYEFSSLMNKLHMGLELKPIEQLTLRAGVDGEQLTGGIGLGIGNLRVDIAWLQNRVLGDTFVISAEFVL
jgi:hypothetical protein